MQISDAGELEGIGAHYGNIDSHGDVILPGACAATIEYAKRTNVYPKMLLQHAQGSSVLDALPVGRWSSLQERPNGLHVRGNLILENSRAADVWALVKAGVLNGLSIGYRARKFEIVPKNANGLRRKLIAIDLLEISIVVDPSNSLARIRNVKSDSGDELRRALERLWPQREARDQRRPSGL